MEIKRKLYKRGSSYETTIPKPLCFNLDHSKKYNIIFKFENNRWYIELKESDDGQKNKE